MLITTLARLRSCQLLLYLLYLAATISGCPTEHRRPIVGSPSYFEGGDSEYRPPPATEYPDRGFRDFPQSQTDSGAHPISYQMGTGGSFPGG